MSKVSLTAALRSPARGSAGIRAPSARSARGKHQPGTTRPGSQYSQTSLESTTVLPSSSPRTRRALGSYLSRSTGIRSETRSATWRMMPYGSGGPRVAGRGGDLDTVAAVLLGGVKRSVRRAHEGRTVGRVIGIDSDPEAGAERARAPVHVQRARLLTQLLGHGQGALAPGRGQQHQELLAARAGREVARAE